jgi:hypothetical protein
MFNEKLIHCKFCAEDIATKNFMRHLKRRHNDENEVTRIFNYPLHSMERRQASAMLRNDTNFNLYITELIRPNRHCTKAINKDATYYPCVHCKGVYTKKDLKRHANSCSLEMPTKVDQKLMDPTQVVSKLNIKEQGVLK